MPSHEAQRTLAYSREQLFNVAADVRSYPEFLPGWIAARIFKHEGNVYHTEQVLGFGTFRIRFRSETLLRRPEQIIVTSSDDIFEKFYLQWFFDPLPNAGCRVAIRVDLDLRSKLARVLFNRAILNSIETIISAFEARVHDIHGPPPGDSSMPGDGVSGTPVL